jgi:hypothetical protein
MNADPGKVSVVNVSTPIALVLFASALSAYAAGTPPPFDRYQVIIDRRMFGELPATHPPPPEGPTQQEQEQFAKSLRLCAIVEEDGKPAKIGFVDGRSNRAYTLGPGQMEDGIELESADFAAGTAMIKQGGLRAELSLASGQAAPAAGGAPAPQVQAAPAAPPAQPPAAGMSYADRRRQRMLQQQEGQAQPPQPKYTGEALQKHLQDYNMEVIRQGLPPLPIPLSPDQDQQLVREGVLPPQ